MMKYLVVFAVLAVAYALWRGQRQRLLAAASVMAAKRPQPMAVCAHCGIHLPQAEALCQGGDSYCCAAHRDHPQT